MRINFIVRRRLRAISGPVTTFLTSFQLSGVNFLTVRVIIYGGNARSVRAQLSANLINVHNVYTRRRLRRV